MLLRRVRARPSGAPRPRAPARSSARPRRATGRASPSSPRCPARRSAPRPRCCTRARSSDDGVVVTSATSKALGALAAGAGVTLPLLAAGPDGHAGLHPRSRRAVCRAHPGPQPGARRRQATVVRVAASPRSRCSSPRPTACSPGWSARSSTRRPTPSTCPPRWSTSPRAATSPSTRTEGGFFGGKDWRLTRTTPRPQARTALLPYEQALLAAMFAAGAASTLSSLKNTSSRPWAGCRRRCTTRSCGAAGSAGRRRPNAARWTGARRRPASSARASSLVWLGGPLSQLGAGTGLPVPPASCCSAGWCSPGSSSASSASRWPRAPPRAAR